MESCVLAGGGHGQAVGAQLGTAGQGPGRAAGRSRCHTGIAGFQLSRSGRELAGGDGPGRGPVHVVAIKAEVVPGIGPGHGVDVEALAIRGKHLGVKALWAQVEPH